MTDVERQEEQFLAATDAKAQHAVEAARRRTSSRAAPSMPAMPPPTCSRRREGRWGSRGVRDHRRHAPRRQRPADARLPLRRAADAAALGPTPHSRSTDFVVRHRHLQRRGRLRLRHEHRHRGARTAVARRATRTVAVHHRRARSGRRHLQARRRRAPARRRAVRLPPAALHLPREVAHEGRRHLPAPAPLGVLVATSSSSREADAGHDARAESRRSGRVRSTTRAPAGRRVVFTNGVFDLLHPGHVRYLQAARAAGRRADRRGQLRPVGPRQQGAVAADHAGARARRDCWRRSRAWTPSSIFDEETPADIIGRLQPDVLVKGADWAADAIVGRDTVEARGGRVVRIPDRAGWSTIVRSWRQIQASRADRDRHLLNVLVWRFARC